MTFTQPGADSTNLPRLPRHELPTMYDLPSEFPEEPGLPDIFHDLQPELLSATLRLQDYAMNEWFSGSDLNVYYDPQHTLWHKRPDWFLAVGVPYLYEHRDMRLSYVTWQEAANPYVIVELLSPGTEDEDLGQTLAKPAAPPTKWTVYEQILQVPYYVVFDRYTDQLRFFKLEAGRYQARYSSENRLWIPELKIGLGLWQGTYKQIERLWLRWCDAEGQWLLTEAELAAQRAEAERQRAEVERQRAAAERQRAEAEQQKALAEQQRANKAEAELMALKARLRAQGINPENF